MKASIHFKPVRGYQPQFSTPVLHPAETQERCDLDQGWLHCLRGNELSVSRVKPIELEGGWDAKRFSFVIQVDNTARKVFGQRTFLYGYTEPCEKLTDETKLYFTRLTEIGSMQSSTPEGPVTYSRNARDLLIFNKQKPEIEAREKQFNAKASSMFRRITADNVFRTVHMLDTRGVVNMTGVIHGYNPSAASVGNITAEGWCAEAVMALMQSSLSFAGDVFGDDDEQVMEHATDFMADSVLDTVDVWDQMTSKSRLGYDGYITYGELKAMMDDPERVFVDRYYRAEEPTPDPSDEAKSLFDFFVKQAVTEAHYNGYGSYHKSWIRLGDQVHEDVLGSSKLVLGTEWDDGRIPEGEPFTKQAPISMPVDSLPKFHGVENWNVVINMGVGDYIVGTVTIGHGETATRTVFVRPSWAIAMTSGLVINEQEVNDLGTVVQRLSSHFINERANLKSPY